MLRQSKIRKGPALRTWGGEFGHHLPGKSCIDERLRKTQQKKLVPNSSIRRALKLSPGPNVKRLKRVPASDSANGRMREFQLRGAGVRLNCLDYGGEGAPPILFIHGGAAHAHWWDFVGQRLRAGCRSFSIDLRGHGDSERPADGDYSVEAHIADLAAALSNWGRGKPVLAAHSGGCFVALPYAAAHPESIAAMAIVEPRIHWPPELLELAGRRTQRPHRRFASLEEACAPTFRHLARDPRCWLMWRGTVSARSPTGCGSIRPNGCRWRGFCTFR